jgi:hypothetical protein
MNDFETVESDVVDVIPQGSISTRQRAEIDSQVATAKAYPRSVSKFLSDLKTMATENAAIAQQCFYVLPRGGRSIEGPSIRLAELALAAYGNAIARAEVVDEDNTFIYVTGWCRDLEKNIAIEVNIRRRIVDKNGKKFNQDMIGVTANAACAIALRNAILKIVPSAYINDVYEECKRVTVGNASTMSTVRSKALNALAQMGADEGRVLNTLGRRAVSDITSEDIVKLRGWFNAIKGGESTVDEMFPEPSVEEVAAQTKKDVKEKAGTKPVKHTFEGVEAPEPKTQESESDQIDEGFMV